MDRLLITIPIDTIGKIETIGLIAYSRTLVNRLGEGIHEKRQIILTVINFLPLAGSKKYVDIRGNIL